LPHHIPGGAYFHAVLPHDAPESYAKLNPSDYNVAIVESIGRSTVAQKSNSENPRTLSSSLAYSFTPYTWPNLLFSTAVIIALVLCALPKRGVVEKWFSSIERSLSESAQRKTKTISTIFFAILAVRLALLRVLPVPIPGSHDEFSYLLMGDTFAHGRLANPTHPMWRSFETFHVNWLPTYSSMYPPVQGAVLAIGQLLGAPWIGVLISNAAMCAAILWMLQAWMPVRWALLGAMLAALKLALASYWMNSYWGGAVAAIGGALILGALPRIRNYGRIRDALLLALGVAILANSRPYEGLLFCAPVAAWLIYWLAGGVPSKLPRATRVRRVLAPIALAIALTAAFMAFYNSHTTGRALLFPYALNLRTYVTGPIFLWQHAKPPLHYNNQQFEDFYNGWERTDYQHTAAGILAVSLLKWHRLRSVFLWPAAAILLPALFFTRCDRRVRFLWIVLLIATPGIFAVVWSNPHYASPLTCVIFALLVQAMRHLRAWRPLSRPIGAALSRAIVILLVMQMIADVRARQCDELAWTCGGDSSREAILQQLNNLPGKHLIMVRYEADHNIHDEWVFNGAEIDSAKVLWARELDAQQNAALFAYFNDRIIWLVDPEVDNLELLPYPQAPSGVQP
jgi:hypothetical protein